MSEKKQLEIKKKVDGNELKGEIILNALSYPERIAMSQEALTGAAPSDAAFEIKAKDDLARAQSYYELAGKQVKSIDITIVSTEEKITTIDELMIYEEGTALVMQLASDLIGGVRLGNGKLNGSDKIA